VYKRGRYVQLTTLPLSVPTVSKSGSLDLLETSVPEIGLHRDLFICIYVLELIDSYHIAVSLLSS
jgi:hypothetical protein